MQVINRCNDPKGEPVCVRHATAIKDLTRIQLDSMSDTFPIVRVGVESIVHDCVNKYQTHVHNKEFE